MSSTLARYALISVFDKSNLETILEALEKTGTSLMGSGGTADAIRKTGRKVLEVSDYTGAPEMPGGLVKTLHPKIHAGILGDWNDPEQRKYLEINKVYPLDFVIVNLYPFQRTIQEDPSNLSKAVDNIDIGGVALIRAAGKGALLNHRVVPVTSPSQYEHVSKQLLSVGHIEEHLREQLARDAFKVTAAYDEAIRNYLEKRSK